MATITQLPRLALLGAVLAFPAHAQEDGAVKRGEYIFAIAGCANCHTAPGGQALAGGRALKTPFGTYYGPNITAHGEHGIGGWSDDDFIRALREGKGPGGGHYFPVFPYTSFTRMTDGDMRDLKAYIFSLPASAAPNRPHEVNFPFGLRLTALGWKTLFFEAGVFRPDPARSDQVNRGAYIVEALGHCGECHTPRNAFGAFRAEMYLAGTPDGPDGDVVPNITSHEKTGLGNWTDDELVALLRDGTLPLGDEVSGGMAEVVRNGTSKLTDADLDAVIAYLRTVPAIENRPFKQAEEQ